MTEALEAKVDAQLATVNRSLEVIEKQNTAIMHALQKKKKGTFFVSHMFSSCVQYLENRNSRINVSCSRTQRSDAGEARTRGPSLESSTLPLSHCAP